MESTFLQFLQACKLLSSDKTTERNPQLPKVVEFLSDDGILDMLDRNSEIPEELAEGKQSFNWDKVFLVCKNYVTKEIDRLSNLNSSNTSISSSLNTSRVSMSTATENKIIALRNLMNLVINQANSRGGNYLKATSFINCLFQFVEKEILLNSKIINDLSNHLHSNILIKHKYCCELSRNHWNELIKLYMKFYLNPIESMDQLCVAKCVQVIAENIITYSAYTNQSRLLKFFEYALSEVKSNVSADLLESLIIPFNKILNAFYKDSLSLIYEIGSKLVPKMLSLLGSKQQEHVKIFVTEFLIFYLEIHFNPKLSYTNDTVFKIVDYDQKNWLEIVKRIYEATWEEINEYCEKQKFSKNKFSVLAENRFINKCYELSSRCFIELVLHDSGDVLEEEHYEIKNSKRAKLDLINWSLLTQNIIADNSCNILTTFSWLCLIEHLNKFLNVFPKSEILNQMKIIISFMNSNTKSEETSITKIAINILNSIVNHKETIAKIFDEIDFESIINTCLNKIKFEAYKKDLYELINDILNLDKLYLNKTTLNALVDNIILPKLSNMKDDSLDYSELKIILTLVEKYNLIELCERKNSHESQLKKEDDFELQISHPFRYRLTECFFNALEKFIARKKSLCSTDEKSSKSYLKESQVNNIKVNMRVNPNESCVGPTQNSFPRKKSFDTVKSQSKQIDNLSQMLYLKLLAHLVSYKCGRLDLSGRNSSEILSFYESNINKKKNEYFCEFEFVNKKRMKGDSKSEKYESMLIDCAKSFVENKLTEYSDWFSNYILNEYFNVELLNNYLFFFQILCEYRKLTNSENLSHEFLKEFENFLKIIKTIIEKRNFHLNENELKQLQILLKILLNSALTDEKDKETIFKSHIFENYLKFFFSYLQNFTNNKSNDSSTILTDENLFNKNFNKNQMKLNEEFNYQLYSFCCFVMYEQSALQNFTSIEDLFSYQSQKLLSIQFDANFNYSAKLNFVCLKNVLYTFRDFQRVSHWINNTETEKKINVMLRFCIESLIQILKSLQVNDIFILESFLKLFKELLVVIIELFNRFGYFIDKKLFAKLNYLYENLMNKAGLSCQESESSQEQQQIHIFNSISCHKLIVKLTSKLVYLNIVMNTKFLGTLVGDFFFNLYNLKSNEIKLYFINSVNFMFELEVKQNLIEKIKNQCSKNKESSISSSYKLSNIFNKIYLVIMDCFEDTKSTDFINFKLNIFLFLKNVIAISVDDKYMLKSLFAFLQLNKLNENKFNAAQFDLLVNSKKFLKININYFLYNWHQLNYNPLEFPYQFFTYETLEEFLHENKAFLIFLCFISSPNEGNEDKLNQLVEAINALDSTTKSISDIIKSTFSDFIVYMLDHCYQAEKCNKKDSPFAFNNIYDQFFSKSKTSLQIDCKMIAKDFQKILIKLIFSSIDSIYEHSDLESLGRKLHFLIVDLFSRSNDENSEVAIRKFLISTLVKSSNGIADVFFMMKKCLFDFGTSNLNKLHTLLEMFQYFLDNFVIKYNLIGESDQKYFLLNFLMHELIDLLNLCSKLIQLEYEKKDKNNLKKMGFIYNFTHDSSKNLTFHHLIKYLIKFSVDSIEKIFKTFIEKQENFSHDLFITVFTFNLFNFFNSNPQFIEQCILDTIFKCLIDANINSNNFKYFKCLAKSLFLLVQETNNINDNLRTIIANTLSANNIGEFLKAVVSKELNKILINEIIEFLEIYFNGEQFSYEFFIQYLLSLLKHVNLNDFMEDLKHKNDSAEIFKEFNRVLIEICSSKTFDNKLRSLSSQCLAMMGPIDFENLLVSTTQRPLEKFFKVLLKREFIFDKFKVENLLSYQQYFTMIENLFEFVLSDNVEEAVVSNELLVKLFETPTIFTFLHEYDSVIKEFAKNSHEDILDKFTEFSKSYRSKKPKSLAMSSLEANEKSIHLINDENKWIPCDSYSAWLKDLCIYLVKSGFLNDEVCHMCIPLFERKLIICEISIPFIIYKLLETNNMYIVNALTSSFQSFFANVCFRNTSKVHEIQKESVKCMIRILDFIRIQKISTNSKCSFWEQPFWTRLNYMNIANAAQKCELYYESLYYIDTWFNEEKKQMDLSRLIRVEPKLIKLLSNSYKMIGEDEAINENIYYQNPNKLMFKNASDYDFYERIFHYDLSMNFCKNSPEVHSDDFMELLNSVSACGLDFILRKLVNKNKELTGEDEKINDLKYECAWKLGDWSLMSGLHENNSNKPKSFHQLIFEELKTMNEIDAPKIEMSYLQDTEKLILDKFCAINSNLKEIVSSHIFDLYSVNKIKQLKRVNCDLTENSSWLHYEKSFFSSNKRFETIDNLYNLRAAFLKSQIKNLGSDETKLSEMRSVVFNLYERLVENAVFHKRFNVSKKYVKEMRQLYANVVSDNILKNKIMICDIKEAKLLKESGEINQAKFLIRNTLDNFKINPKNPDHDLLKSYLQSLDLYALYLDETKCENPIVILQECLETSIGLIQKFDIKGDAVVHAYYSIAKFADLQFYNICSYMKSSTFEQKQELMKKIESEAIRVEKLEPDSKFRSILRKQLDIDEKELKTLQSDRDEYLCRAIKNYLYCLELGNQYDMRVFRLVSLWTENCANVKVNKLMENRIFKISSHKFLPLMYQLAARMSVKHVKNSSKEAASSQLVLNEKLFHLLLLELIFNAANEHPHHVLPIIFALANAYKDEQFMNSQKGTRKSASASKASKSGENFVIAEERINAARYLIDKLKSKHSELIASSELLYDAYIELANFSIDNNKKGNCTNDAVQLPKGLMLNQVKNLQLMPVLTNTIPVNIDANYSNLVHIVKFESTIRLANGINLPKIVTCLGSDGQFRKQLVKGRDDMRQDAVLQQMFGMVNDLLKKNANTRKNKLNIRRYKIVPLSQKSGVIEWCDGTIPFGEWLVGNDGGAHKRYNPGDWHFADCKKKLYDASSNLNNRKTKLQIFNEICENLKPVFRNFFIENYLDAHVWLEKRLNYTRSVATSSVIGYIIGLGDRHVQNILIDKQTAEVIHIDLGVAFEQGKMLPMPETVPFRLTRDIIDGFGICGIDGVFRSSCEATLRVMIDSREDIMTIFEVLLYDPLYNWTLSPKKAYMLQQMKNSENAADFEQGLGNTSIIGTTASSTSNEKNKIAERILFVIRQKLQGYENGVQLSCSGQINLLIQEATNPENLCRLYAGWQPYL